jgi:putative oxidoreductase
MSSLLKLIDRAYALLVRVANSLQSPFLLVVRLYWGWQFAESGVDHLRNMDSFVQFMTDNHVPAPWLNAHFVAGLETCGGILLALGLGSRLIAIPLLVNMIVAFITADRDNLFAAFTSHAEDFYKALPFTYLFVALLVLIFGPGSLSLDALIKRYRSQRQSTSAATP